MFLLEGVFENVSLSMHQTTAKALVIYSQYANSSCQKLRSQKHAFLALSPTPPPNGGMPRRRGGKMPRRQKRQKRTQVEKGRKKEEEKRKNQDDKK